MRIDGPKSTERAQPRKTSATGKGDGKAFASALGQGEAAAAPRGAAGAGPLAAVDAIMALQAVGDASQGRSKGLAQAGAVLDALEEIRRGLLLGIIPAGKLQALGRVVAEQRAANLDPALEQLLDDIDLRARVELAKLGLRMP